jgi:hypothetical protein
MRRTALILCLVLLAIVADQRGGPYAAAVVLGAWLVARALWAFNTWIDLQQPDPQLAPGPRDLPTPPTLVIGDPAGVLQRAEDDALIRLNLSRSRWPGSADPPGP